jgi:hypothetical protein
MWREVTATFSAAAAVARPGYSADELVQDAQEALQQIGDAHYDSIWDEQGYVSTLSPRTEGQS